MHQKIESRVYQEKEASVFYRVRGRFGELSNMAGGFPLEIAGIPVGSSEAYYQAIRWSHRPDVQQRILDEKSPMTAKRTAYLFLDDGRPDWDQVKIRVMRFALRAKLLFHDDAIRAVLSETGDHPIVEKSQRDDFWGALPHGDGTLRGRNVLGRLWMELRHEIAAKPEIFRNGIDDPRIPDHRLLDREVTGLEPPVRPVQTGFAF